MRWAVLVVGLLLIGFGILSFTNRFPTNYFSFSNSATTEQNIGDDADVDASSKDTHKGAIPAAPILGIIALGGGIALVAKSLTSSAGSGESRA